MFYRYKEIKKSSLLANSLTYNIIILFLIISTFTDASFRLA